SGLQAAGKTSYYHERFAVTHAHVSKDTWPNARRREKRQRRLVEEHLRCGRSVVIDNTNPTPVERVPLIAIARATGARTVSYYFVVPVDEAPRRNDAREGRVRIDVVGIYSVAKRLVSPSRAEGFDALFEVRLTASGFAVIELA